jgi:hypothetical protein
MDFRREARLNNLVVAGLVASGAIAFGCSLQGRQTELIEYCFKPNNDPQYCTPEKRYLMAADEFNRITSDPTSIDDRIFAKHVTRLRVIPPTNPYKWLWSLTSFGFFGAAGALSKARERKLMEYLPTYRESVKQSWALNRLEHWLRERGEMLNAYNTDRKRQYAADLDFQLWKFGSDRAARAKQLSMLSPEEILVFQQEARKAALAEAQKQREAATQPKPQPQLPGQSLDEITDPSDKLEAEEILDAAISAGDTTNPTSAASSDPFSEYRLTGQSIFRSMVVSDKSILIASGTGTGKSTTEEYYLQQFVRKYPKATIYALLNKNDNLYGVEPKNKLVFSPEVFGAMPSEKAERAEIIESAVAPLFSVYRIFLKRKQLTTAERKQLKESQPIRLVLGDWYGTYQELQARLTKDELQGVLSIIRQIITIGRDMGIGLVIDTQSANLDSLGLVSDASIRQSLDIFSQGFIYHQDGEEKGELQTIRLMFSNKSICSPEDREAIAAGFKVLSDAIRDGHLKTPIIFTSVGSRPRLGIVPELSEGMQITNIDWKKVDWSDIASRLETGYLISEFMIEPPSEEENPEDEDSEEIEESTKSPLGQAAQTVLKIIEAATKYPISFESIRKSRRWSSKPDSQILRNALQELMDAALITGDEETGYSLS